ncbi:MULTISPECIES: hypothetical protein [unclassified Streptomyces]|nr:hypothetical protein [Streptomyces sp. NBC_00401]MCX5083630.1 hypothetical protein [Streptomyces sp. NBC_00401]
MNSGGLGRQAARTALAAAVVLSVISLSGRAQPAAARPTVHKGAVHTIAVPDGARRVIGARSTEPFSMLGITWSDPSAALGGTAQIRTRSAATGHWSAWRTLELDVHAPESGPAHTRKGVRGGTQPLWVGAADGVQARVIGAKLPAGLRVDLVDPDAGTRAAYGPSALGSPAGTGIGGRLAG